MSDALQAQQLAARLSRMRIAALIVLLASGAACLLVDSGGGPPVRAGLDPFTLAAAGVALGSILARRTADAPNTPGARRVQLTLLAWALAVGLGLLGIFAAVKRSDPNMGLLFALGGIIFCLAARPPPIPGAEGSR